MNHGPVVVIVVVVEGGQKKNHQLIKGSEVFRPELLSLLWLSVMMIASIYFTCGYPINVGPVYR